MASVAKMALMPSGKELYFHLIFFQPPEFPDESSNSIANVLVDLQDSISSIPSSIANVLVDLQDSISSISSLANLLVDLPDSTSNI